MSRRVAVIASIASAARAMCPLDPAHLKVIHSILICVSGIIPVAGLTPFTRPEADGKLGPPRVGARHPTVSPQGWRGPSAGPSIAPPLIPAAPNSSPSGRDGRSRKNQREPNLMKRNEQNRLVPLQVFVVDEIEGDKPFWTCVGSAWPHQDGKGFSIDLVAMPLNGRLVVREPKAQEAGK
jgi:hypothetical protein